MVSTTICMAICKPDNCYSGACGAADENHFGIYPNNCSANNRIGDFFQDGATPHENGEHCHFLWRGEYGSNFMPSKYSDTVGYCYDHTKYLYDKDGDGTAETPLPPCATLPIFGAGSQVSDADYWGRSSPRLRRHDEGRPSDGDWQADAPARDREVPRNRSAAPFSTARRATKRTETRRLIHREGRQQCRLFSCPQAALQAAYFFRNKNGSFGLRVVTQTPFLRLVCERRLRHPERLRGRADRSVLLSACSIAPLSIASYGTSAPSFVGRRG